METLRNRKRSLTALVVLALVALLVWRCWPNRHLARAQELQNQLAGEAGRKLAPEQRRALGKQLRAEMEKLQPEQRRDLFRNRGKQDLKKYFDMPPREKLTHLDASINQMEQWKKQAGKGGNWPKGPPQGKRPSSGGDREQARKVRLDHSTPEERVMRALYFKDLNARRQQRGMGTLGGPGRRG